MEENFVSYEIALALKQLGFDEECLGIYYGDGILSYDYDPEMYSSSLPAPLYQQAFKFFREKYNLHYIIYKNINMDGYDFCEITNDGITNINNFKTYEEAQIQCLIKLIEVCKKIKL